MAIPQRVGADSCDISRRWLLDPTLVSMLQTLDGWANAESARKGIRWPGLFIISGHRTQKMQAYENPDAPNSLHLRCPALAVDLRVGGTAASVTSDPIWNWLGARWRLMGGRWGGAIHCSRRKSLRPRCHFSCSPQTPLLNSAVLIQQTSHLRQFSTVSTVPN